MCETFSSSTFVTQTPPNPVAIACGCRPTGTSAMSLFDAGSITPTESAETPESPPPESRVTRNAARAASTSSATAAAMAMLRRERAAAGGALSPSRSAERVAATNSPAER